MNTKTKKFGLAGMCLVGVVGLGSGCIVTSSGQYAEDVTRETFRLGESSRQRNARLSQGMTIKTSKGYDIKIYEGFEFNFAGTSHIEKIAPPYIYYSHGKFKAGYVNPNPQKMKIDQFVKWFLD